jgi:hypothetical protein
MREQVTFVTQSKYFSPAFNAAIFDGPIRIYFAQYQEAAALKVYFHFQERYADLRRQASGIFKNRARNIFVMLYPTAETFDLSFGEVEPLASGMGAEALPSAILCEQLGEDHVIGVRGPLEDSIINSLYLEVDQIVRSAEA